MTAMRHHHALLAWAKEAGSCATCAQYIAIVMIERESKFVGPIYRAQPCKQGRSWLASTCDERLREQWAARPKGAINGSNNVTSSGVAASVAASEDPSRLCRAAAAVSVGGLRASSLRLDRQEGALRDCAAVA